MSLVNVGKTGNRVPVTMIDAHRKCLVFDHTFGSISDQSVPLAWFCTCHYMIGPDIDAAPNLNIILIPGLVPTWFLDIGCQLVA